MYIHVLFCLTKSQKQHTVKVYVKVIRCLLSQQVPPQTNSLQLNTFSHDVVKRSKGAFQLFELPLH